MQDVFPNYFKRGNHQAISTLAIFVFLGRKEQDFYF